MDYKTNPDAKRVQDIEDLPIFAQKFIEKIQFNDGEFEKIKQMVTILYELMPETNEELFKMIRLNAKKCKIFPSLPKLLRVYREMVANGDLEKNYDFMHLLINKPVRSASGVLVVTIFTSPYPQWWEDGELKTQKFSCDWNCYYCPNEPDQPRSYLLKEPGVMRANQMGFDEVKQFNTRVRNLQDMGHPVDKLEIMILGGTWESYPKLYREQFIRNIFYAANIYGCEKRPPFPLEEEVQIQSGKMNIFDDYFSKFEQPKTRIIGVTIETRPDTINEEMIKELRRLQVTRLQIGVQHTDNRILKKINRQCTIEDAERAFKLLKDNCFKIDIHLMPDLPFSSPEIDKAMFNRVLTDSNLQVDQWKIYPCATVPWTVIKQWHESGKYKPYGDSAIVDVLCDVKSKVHPWIRLNRVVRDIPDEYITAGNSNPGLRSMLPKEMEKRGYRCKCIRCREVGFNPPKVETELKVRIYAAQEGKEFFISYESKDEKYLFGFCRLRLTNAKPIFKELEGAALIRELHVYGTLLPVAENSKHQHTQHRGIGTLLLKEAEKIAKDYRYKKIAVISGTGVRGYYRKKGYHLEGSYMVKKLNNYDKLWAIVFISGVIHIFASLFLFSENS